MMPKVLGIVNVTPDSFSDGGRYFETEAAIERAIDLHEQGADLIDIGGESTRPGAQRVSLAEERERVLPVIQELASRGIGVSVDTMRAEIAAEALACGAQYINDVSGGKADPEMFDVVAESGAPYILMHWRAHSIDMVSMAEYDNVTRDVLAEIMAQVDLARAAGVRDEQIICDPGLGFAKNTGHNWQLLRELGEFQSMGFPVLIGHSRKRFLRESMGLVTPAQIDQATAALSALAAYHGVWGIRVHNVKASRLAMQVAGHWKQEAP